MDEPRDPSLETLLDAHRDVILDGINVMLPGQILSYDATKQLASAQPLIQRRHIDEDGETIIVTDCPAVHNCPVVFAGPARGRITWPVATGDTCEIRFASASIARWVLSGGMVDPGDDRRHDLSDATVYVGLHDSAHVPTDAPTDAVVIHATGGVTIKLGSSAASQAVVVQSALTYFMTKLATAITAMGPDPAVSALVALNSALGSWLAGTTKTKAE